MAPRKFRRPKKEHRCQEDSECGGDTKCLDTRIGRRCLCSLAKSMPLPNDWCPNIMSKDLELDSEFSKFLHNWANRTDLVRYPGGCDPTVCGMTTGCHPLSGNMHLCICPVDTTQPIGDHPDEFICPRYPSSNSGTPGVPSTLTFPFLSENLKPTTASIESGDISTTPMPAVAPVSAWSLALVASLSAGLFLLVVLIALTVRGRKKASRPETPAASEAGEKKPDLLTVRESLILIDRIQSNPNYYQQESDEMAALLSVKRIGNENVIDMVEIGQGCFGKVFKGTYLCEEGEPVQVAVKQLKEASHVDLQNLINEVEIMASCRHPNIVSFLGILMQEDASSPWMVFEYMCHGDLVELLRENSDVRGKPGFDTVTQHSFASQIAAGMAYLASQHFVHRDLACRNILVGENLVAKISDFGMSRDVYTSDYYKVAGGARMMPVRWMSPESISYGRFTFEGDIWSYGVVLWEIFAHGKQPYFGHSNEEVVRLVTNHILLMPPSNCPPAICDILELCWRTEPKDRTNFPTIVQMLANAADEIREYSSGYMNVKSVDYTELDHTMIELTSTDRRAEPLQLDHDHYLQPDAVESDYIQPIP